MKVLKFTSKLLIGGRTRTHIPLTSHFERSAPYTVRRQTEVGQIPVPAVSRNKHVLGLYIAVKDPFSVAECQSVDELQKDHLRQLFLAQVDRLFSDRGEEVSARDGLEYDVTILGVGECAVE